MLGVEWDTGHRANLYTLGRVMVAHTFSAFGWVNLVDRRAHEDRRVGALGFTHITVDAFIGDHQCHGVWRLRFGV
jgi:hypothetical protein